MVKHQLHGKFPLTNEQKQNLGEYTNLIKRILQDPNFKKVFGNNNSIRSLTDLNNISSKKLSGLIECFLPLKTQKEYEKEFHLQIPGKALVSKDFNKIKKEDIMLTRGWSKYDLTLRAIHGHAQSGHSEFRDGDIPLRFKNTTTQDIIRILEENEIKINNYKPIKLREFQQRTQDTIDTIVQGIDDFFNSPEKYAEPIKFKGHKNTPYAGSLLFNQQKYYMIEFLRGLYFGLVFDSEEKRMLVNKKYNHLMGWGDHYIFDRNEIKKYPLTLENISKKKYFYELKFLEYLSSEKIIEIFKNLNIIQKTRETDITKYNLNKINWEDIKCDLGIQRNLSSKDLHNLYLRKENGYGLSDDIAIYLSYFLPQTFSNKNHIENPLSGISRMMGAFVGDFIDTIQMDSHVIFEGAQDGLIAKYLDRKFKEACKNKKFRDLFNINYEKNEEYSLVSDSALTDFIGISSNIDLIFKKKDEFSPNIIHSSQRHFYLNHSGTCAILEYLHLANERNKHYQLGLEPHIRIKNKQKLQCVDLTYLKMCSLEIFKEMIARTELIIDSSKRENKIYSRFNQ